MPEPYSVATIQGCDVRKLWKLPLLGSHCVKARSDYVFGSREAVWDVKRKETEAFHPEGHLLSKIIKFLDFSRDSASACDGPQ